MALACLTGGVEAPEDAGLEPLAEQRHLQVVTHPAVDRVILTGGWDTAKLFRSWRPDLPLLAAVGNPVAVRPDVSLFRHARRSHWTIVDWASPDTAARPLNPAFETSRSGARP